MCRGCGYAASAFCDSLRNCAWALPAICEGCLGWRVHARKRPVSELCPPCKVRTVGTVWGGAARDGLKYLTFWRRDGVGNVIFLNLLLAGLYRLGGKRHPCA